MIILHAIGNLTGGGAEKQLNIYINNCNNYFHHHIICFNNTGETLYPTNTNIVVIHKKHKFDINRKEISKLLLIINPDIIHIWIPAMLPYFVFINKNIRRKSFIICGIRSTYELFRPLRIIQQRMYYRVNGIISNVHPLDLNYQYKKLFKIKISSYIPNAFNNLNNNLNIISNFHNRPLKLLFIGRFIKEKNISILLELGKLLIENKYEFTFDFYGEGMLLEKIKNKSNHYGLNNHFTFHGFCDNINNKITKYDILVLPSYREGMPNVAFEAINAGLIICVSKIRAHNRWFKHSQNALLFNPSNLEELYSNIKTIKYLSSEKVNDMRFSALDTIKDLTILNMVTNLNDYYKSVL